MEQEKKEQTGWRKIVLVIIGVWAVLTSAGFVIELVTVGTAIEPSAFIVDVCAVIILIVLIKKGVFGKGFTFQKHKPE